MALGNYIHFLSLYFPIWEKKCNVIQMTVACIIPQFAISTFFFPSIKNSNLSGSFEHQTLPFIHYDN